MSNLLPESMLAEIRARAEAVPMEPPFSHGAFAIADRRKLLAHIEACSSGGAREYPAIWLRKDGDNRFVVAVEVSNGRWVDVIHEFDGGGGMSHIVEPAGIKARIDGDPGVKPCALT